MPWAALRRAHGFIFNGEAMGIRNCPWLFLFWRDIGAVLIWLNA